MKPVMQWLNENDDASLQYLIKIFEHDKSSGFQQSSEHTLFSNSVVDVFTQLTQRLEVINKLECPDPEITKRYMKRFAKTIVKVLTTYAEILKKDFKHYVKQEKTACILLNNIQQLRVQLEKMFESMGGENLESDAADILKDLQQTLNSQLDELATVFSASLEPTVRQSVVELSGLLAQIKQQGSTKVLFYDLVFCQLCLCSFEWFAFIEQSYISLVNLSRWKRINLVFHRSKIRTIFFLILF